MKQAVVVGVFVCLATGVLAQQPTPLDRPFTENIGALVPLGAAEAPMLAMKIAASVGIPLGFQQASPLPVGTPQREHKPLQGLTARQAFDLIASLDPRYSWQDMNGVAVFRPVTAWTDTADILNKQVAAVDWQGKDARTAADSLTTLLFGTPSRRDTTASGKTFSVHFAGGQVVDLLNAVVTADGALMWTVQPDPTGKNKNLLLLTLKGFDGQGAVTTWNVAR